MKRQIDKVRAKTARLNRKREQVWRALIIARQRLSKVPKSNKALEAELRAEIVALERWLKRQMNPGFFTATRQRKVKEDAGFQMLDASKKRTRKGKGERDAFGVAANPGVLITLQQAKAQLERDGSINWGGVMVWRASDNEYRVSPVGKLSHFRVAHTIHNAFKIANRMREQIQAAAAIKNPNFFGPESIAKAKPVTKIRRVRQKDTGELGEIIGSPGQGWLKVKWDNRQRPTLIKRSEIAAVRAIKRNPKKHGYSRAKIEDALRRLRAEYDATQLKYSQTPGNDPYRSDILLKRLVELSRKIKRLQEVLAKQPAGKLPNPRKRSKNPSVNELAQTFQGKVSGAVSEYKAANAAPSDLARIGKLVFLKLRDVRRQIAAPGAMVAVDTKGKLWLTSTRAPMFNNKAKPGTVNDFGEVEKICYLTAKAHVGNGELTEYVHEFGEDGGARPHLLVDAEGMPILQGGAYRIEKAGIVN